LKTSLTISLQNESENEPTNEVADGLTYGLANHPLISLTIS